MNHCTRCGCEITTFGRQCKSCSQTRDPNGPGEWRNEAECLNEDPELFYPLGWGPSYAFQINTAKDVCATCPVIAECLTWALEARDEHAIAGGTTPDERRLIRRREDYARRRDERQAVSA